MHEAEADAGYAVAAAVAAAAPVDAPTPTLGPPLAPAPVAPSAAAVAFAATHMAPRASLLLTNKTMLPIVASPASSSSIPAATGAGGLPPPSPRRASVVLPLLAVQLALTTPAELRASSSSSSFLPPTQPPQLHPLAPPSADAEPIAVPPTPHAIQSAVHHHPAPQASRASQASSSASSAASTSLATATTSITSHHRAASSSSSSSSTPAAPRAIVHSTHQPVLALETAHVFAAAAAAAAPTVNQGKAGGVVAHPTIDALPAQHGFVAQPRIDTTLHAPDADPKRALLVYASNARPSQVVYARPATAAELESSVAFSSLLLDPAIQAAIQARKEASSASGAQTTSPLRFDTFLRKLGNSGGGGGGPNADAYDNDESDEDDDGSADDNSKHLLNASGASHRQRHRRRRGSVVSSRSAATLAPGRRRSSAVGGGAGGAGTVGATNALLRTDTDMSVGESLQPTRRACCICMSTSISEPWLSKCGHVCCAECWVNWMQENAASNISKGLQIGVGVCPECDAPVDLESLRQVALCEMCGDVLRLPGEAAPIVVDGGGGAAISIVSGWTAPCSHACCNACWRGQLVAQSAAAAACPVCKAKIEEKDVEEWKKATESEKGGRVDANDVDESHNPAES